MTVAVTHTKVSTKTDGPDAELVRPSDWNASHTLIDVASLQKGTIVPVHTAPEGTFYWRTTTERLYVNTDGGTTWVDIVDAQVADHASAADPHTGYQKESEKDAASGYAGLTAGTKLNLAQMQEVMAHADLTDSPADAHHTEAHGAGQHSAVSDATAIHDNVAGEIAAITEKATPVAADLMVIEDSAAGDIKKRVQLGNLPGGGGGGAPDIYEGGVLVKAAANPIDYKGSFDVAVDGVGVDISLDIDEAPLSGLAKLLGRAGGQTLHGGDATTEKLVLKGNTADAEPYTQTFGYHEFTGVERPAGSGQIEVGVLRSLGSFGGVDLIYLIPFGVGQPQGSYGQLTFPAGFTSRTRAVVNTPQNTTPSQILTVQPYNNNATGPGDAVFGQMFVGSTTPAATVRGLRYEVGSNPGAGSIAELIGCLTGLRTVFATANPVTLGAYFRGDPFIWDAAVALTSIYGIDLPEITRGTNRWGGGRSRDPSANAGSYAYGWQVDEFSGAVTNQYPFYYGDPLVASRGMFSVDRYGSIHTVGELAYTIAALTLANGDNNNVAAGTKSFVRVAGPTAAFAITGIAGGFDGKRLVIYNPTGNNMTLRNESASSTAANRITTLTGADSATNAAGAMHLIYSATDSRWILLGTQG